MLTDFLKGKRVAAAVSGGVDSVVLLDKLARARKELDIELMVINVEHGIRAESKADSLFVKELAAGYGVPFFCFEVDSPSFAKANKLSEETAARILRYRAFEKFDGCDVIALAHHMSDQAESILMHILRGSGTSGAAGMKAVSGRYVRPLLDTPKAEIDAYADGRGLKFVVDKTNFENDKTRNFLRNVVFPELNKINARAAENICRFGGHVRADTEFLDGLAAAIPMEKESGRATFCCDAETASSPLFARLVFRAATSLGVFADVESRHIDDLNKLALFGATGASLDLPHGMRAVKEYGKLTFTRGAAEKYGGEVAFAAGETVFDGKKVVVTPGRNGGLYFDGGKLPPGCVIRHRREGDVFAKFGGGAKKLKDYLIDKKIPARERDGLTLVAKGKEVYIICGVEISRKIKVDKNSESVYSIVVNQL